MSDEDLQQPGKAGNGSPQEAGAGDIVHLEGRRMDSISAQAVSIRKGAAGVIEADSVRVEKGGVKHAEAHLVEVHEGGIGSVQGGTVTVTDGGVGLARCEVLNVEDGGVGIALTRTAELSGTRVVFLAAREVHGDARALIDLRAGLLFGLAAGAAMGLLGLLFRRRHD